MKDYYRILEIHPEARAEVIAAAYRRLALIVHPDVTKDDGARMSDLNEAYEVLSDPQRRLDYDRLRPTQAPTKPRRRRPPGSQRRPSDLNHEPELDDPKDRHLYRGRRVVPRLSTTANQVLAMVLNRVHISTIVLLGPPDLAVRFAERLAQTSDGKLVVEDGLRRGRKELFAALSQADEDGVALIPDLDRVSVGTACCLGAIRGGELLIEIASPFRELRMPIPFTIVAGSASGAVPIQAADAFDYVLGDQQSRRLQRNLNRLAT